MKSWFLIAVMLGAAMGAFPQGLDHRSPFTRVAMAADQPYFSQLAVDSLGQNKLDQNLMLPPGAAASHYEVASRGQRIEYRVAGSQGAPAWSFEIGDRGMLIRSAYSAKN